MPLDRPSGHEQATAGYGAAVSLTVRSKLHSE